MLLLLVVISLQNISSIRNSYAFDIGIPDIPFLNFNFDDKDSSENKDNFSEKDHIYDSYSLSDNTNEIESADISPDEKTDTPILYFEQKNKMDLYDSLPFPSNTVNTAMYDQADNPEEESITGAREFNQISSYSPDTLPLISDYTDFPLNFLLDSETKVGKEIPNQFIVVLKENNAGLSDILSAIAENTDFHGVQVLQVYEEVLSGIAIKVPNKQVIESIESLPMVDYIENDIMAEAFDQTISTGINRIDADMSSTNSGDGNGNIDIDIAILDSGIDLNHSDLNIYHQKSFVNSNTGLSSFFGMSATTAPTADDDNGHGTHVAGIAAAKDNTIGSVGVAPGAKLWAIKVLDNKGTGPLSTIIKGIDYVTKYANQIEVVNLSLGCECKSAAFDTAINNSVKAGIVFVVAAGNAGKDALNTSPSNNPNVISVSALADSDGKCGEQGSNTGYGLDDSLATFSNYGSVIDIAAPGAKIYSTYKGNSYATMSGTSMASPHVAGAAALYLIINPDASPSMVKSALLNHGSNGGTSCDGNGFGYFSGDKDQVRESLLNVKDY